MARFEIKIEGFTSKGQSKGRASRVLNGALTMDVVQKNIAALKGQIKVGNAGRHVIRVLGDNFAVERTDVARAGFRDAQIGTFTSINV